jgi:toxin CptA
MAVLLTLAHGAVFACIVSSGVPIWGQIFGALMLIAHLAHCVRWHAFLLPAGAAAVIEINSNNEFSLETRSGERHEYDVLGSTYVMPYLTVLHLQQRESRDVKRVALLPDSLHADDFRRLRVWLRWKDDKTEL